MQRDPANTTRVRLLSFVLNGIGDALTVQNDWPGALEHYQRAFDLRNDLARRDPENIRAALNLAVSLSLLGDVSSAQGATELASARYLEAIRIVDKLRTTADHPSDVQQQIFTIDMKTGAFFCKRRSIDAATERYRFAMEIAGRFVAIDPTNSGWARDLERARQFLTGVHACT
jgi:tetratricopeptide (TPR) repeat protein